MLTVVMGLERGVGPHHGRGHGGALVKRRRGRRRRRRLVSATCGGGVVVAVVGRRTGGGDGRGHVVAAVLLVMGRSRRVLLPRVRRAPGAGTRHRRTDGRRMRRWRWCRRCRRCTVLMMRDPEHVRFGRRHVHYSVVLMVAPVTVFCNHTNTAVIVYKHLI